MNDPVIEVHNISKIYRIGKMEKKSDSLAGSLYSLIKSPYENFSRIRKLSNFKDTNSNQNDIIWALKDISFSMNKGEVMGFIGPNGAGKSTLLKILSRITLPTSGRAIINGKVSSLLEVGTGFHHELTGRENIYLNGTILGMSKNEINKKFDQIVDFSGIEQFIETPVKRYSSGMAVRLAFAIAAHMEPEILIVDEVLAVGDAEFQKKCLGKMSEVSKQGRTILFVSHNMIAVKSLCDKAIWLDKGKIVEMSTSKEVVSNYLKLTNNSNVSLVWDGLENNYINEHVQLLKFHIFPKNGTDNEIYVDTPFEIIVEYKNLVPDSKLNIHIELYNGDDICIFNAVSDEQEFKAGLIKSKCFIPANLLNNSNYRVRLLILKNGNKIIMSNDNIASFDVQDVGRKGNWYGNWAGVVRPKLEWETKFIK